MTGVGPSVGGERGLCSSLALRSLVLYVSPEPENVGQNNTSNRLLIEQHTSKKGPQNSPFMVASCDRIAWDTLEQQKEQKDYRKRYRVVGPRSRLPLGSTAEETFLSDSLWVLGPETLVNGDLERSTDPGLRLLSIERPLEGTKGAGKASFREIVVQGHSWRVHFLFCSLEACSQAVRSLGPSLRIGLEMLMSNFTSLETKRDAGKRTPQKMSKHFPTSQEIRGPKKSSNSKVHPKPSQEFLEQIGPFHHENKGFSENSHQQVHPKFAKRLGRQILGNTFSDPKKFCDNTKKRKVHTFRRSHYA